MSPSNKIVIFPTFILQPRIYPVSFARASSFSFLTKFPLSLSIVCGMLLILCLSMVLTLMKTIFYSCFLE